MQKQMVFYYDSLLTSLVKTLELKLKSRCCVKTETEIISDKNPFSVWNAEQATTRA